MKFLIRIATILPFMLFPCFLKAQFNYTAWHYSEFSWYRDNQKRYYENWTELRLLKNQWTLGFRLDMHIPSQPYSPERNGKRLSQGFLTFHTSRYDVTVGNYYKIIGRGLVFHSFENRTIRWDTNVLGMDINMHRGPFQLNAFGGKPRDRSGLRIAPVFGGAVSVQLGRPLKLGFHALTSETINNRKVAWGSVSMESYFPQGNFYVEVGYSEPFVESGGNGKAIFLAGDMYLSDITLHLEYKNYHRFQLSYGSLYNYNNLPTAFREHLFALLNRKQHLVNGNNETGFMMEISGPLKELGNWLLNVNQSFLRNGYPVYREYYSQLELTNTERYEIILAGGVEQDLEANYLNGVISIRSYLNESHSLKFQIEHQHETIRFSKRKFYNQLFTLSYSHLSFGSITYLIELTRDQLAPRKNWQGIQLDMNSFQHMEISVFYGRRREGKICAGGVCVYKPEFSGIEMTMNLHLP
jgi:hypothetical protein